MNAILAAPWHHAEMMLLWHQPRLAGQVPLTPTRPIHAPAEERPSAMAKRTSFRVIQGSARQTEPELARQVEIVLRSLEIGGITPSEALEALRWLCPGLDEDRLLEPVIKFSR